MKTVLLLFIFLSMTIIGFQTNDIIWTTAEAVDLDVWFNYTVNNGLISCWGHYTGNLTQYCWNVTTARNVLVGSTGWINVTNATREIFYSYSVGNADVYEITFYGKNSSVESDYQTRFLATEYNAPRIEPEEPEYIPREGLGILEPPKEYEVPIAGLYYLDIRLLLFIVIAVVFIYFASAKYRKKPIKKRLASGRMVIVKRRKK